MGPEQSGEVLIRGRHEQKRLHWALFRMWPLLHYIVDSPPGGLMMLSEDGRLKEEAGGIRLK